MRRIVDVVKLFDKCIQPIKRYILGPLQGSNFLRHGIITLFTVQENFRNFQSVSVAILL